MNQSKIFPPMSEEYVNKFIFYINFLDEQYKRTSKKLDPEIDIWNDKYWQIVFPETLVDKKEGCYVIYSMNYETYKKDLLYIGTSVNLNQRLATHEVFGVLKNILAEYTLLFSRIFYIEGSDRLKLEKRLIKTYKPPINKIYNGS